MLLREEATLATPNSSASNAKVTSIQPQTDDNILELDSQTTATSTSGLPAFSDHEGQSQVDNEPSTSSGQPDISSQRFLSTGVRVAVEIPCANGDLCCPRGAKTNEAPPTRHRFRERCGQRQAIHLGFVAKPYIKCYTKVEEFLNAKGEEESRSVRDPSRELTLESCQTKFVRAHDREQRRYSALDALNDNVA